LSLTNDNSYTGATTISGGVLAVNGTGDINQSAVTINGGDFRYNSSIAYISVLTFTSGTVSGTNWGTSLGNLTIGANQTVSPGNSPGTAVTTGQTWAGGGTYLWEMNDATGTAGLDPGWDLINGTGTLAITATDVSQFTIQITSLTLDNLAGEAENFDDLLSQYWLLANFASITGFSSDAFALDTSAFSNPFTGNFGIALGDTGSIGGTENQIYLTYTAIPEPHTAILGALGVLLLFRRRRQG
jgi:autotransporter-associated beta strand protein